MEPRYEYNWENKRVEATVEFYIIQVFKGNWNWSFLSNTILLYFSVIFWCFVLWVCCSVLVKETQEWSYFTAFYGDKGLGSAFLRQAMSSLFPERLCGWSSVSTTSGYHFNSLQTCWGASASYYSYFSLRQIECGVWKGSLHAWRFLWSLCDKVII